LAPHGGYHAEGGWAAPRLIEVRGSRYQAQVYEAEGNDLQTYLLLYRHAKLVLDNLAKHPERSLPENKKGFIGANVAVGKDLERLEILKPRIEKRHAEWLERRKAQQKALEALEGRGASAHNLPQELDGLSIQPGQRKRPSFEQQTLDGRQNITLAAKLAQREVRRRDAARRSVRQAGVSEEEEMERRTGGMWGNWEKEFRRESDEIQDDELSRQIQEVAHLQNGHKAQNFTVSWQWYWRVRLLTVAATDIRIGLTCLSLSFSTTPDHPGTVDKFRCKTIITRSHAHPTSQRAVPPAV
jgi:hypothetical protein